MSQHITEHWHLPSGCTPCANTRYSTGTDNYLNVLTAQNSLSSQQTLVALQPIYDVSGAVDRTLGGGWNTAELLPEKAVQA